MKSTEQRITELEQAMIRMADLMERMAAVQGEVVKVFNDLLTKLGGSK